MSTDATELGTTPDPVVEGEPLSPETPPSPDGDTAADPTEPETSLLNAFGDDSFRSKYKTDAEFVKGVKEMQAALSRRDEFAAYGKSVQDFAPDFQEFLDSKRQPKPEPQPTATALPKPHEVALLKARVLDANGQVRQGAKPEDVRKLQEVNEILEQRMYEYLLDPEGFVGKFIEPKLTAAQKAAAEVAQQEVSRGQMVQAEQTRVNQFVDTNSEWIFANGTGGDLSPQGERLKAYVQEEAQERVVVNGQVVTQADIFPESRLITLAMRRLQAEQGEALVKPSGKPPKGGRTPNKTHAGESLQAQKAKKIAAGISLPELSDWCESVGIEL